MWKVCRGEPRNLANWSAELGKICSWKLVPTVQVWSIHTVIGVRAMVLGRGLQLLPSRAKPLFFRQKLNFAGRSQHPKMKKIVFIKRKQRNSFRLARQSAWSAGLLLMIIWWGESGKVILPVSLAVIFGAVEKLFWATMAHPPLEKNWPICLCIELKRLWTSCTTLWSMSVFRHNVVWCPVFCVQSVLTAKTVWSHLKKRGICVTLICAFVERYGNVQ